MSSPVFSGGSEFKPGATFDQQGNAVTADQLQQMYDAPSATAVDTGRMSYEGTIAKTAGIAILTMLAAAPGYMFPNVAGMWIGGLAAFVLSLVIIFQKRANPVLIALYAVAEGYFLGAITAWVETRFDIPGAGLQALIATFVTFAVCLALYRSGKVRYGPKMQKFLMIGGLSYLVFSLINLGYMWFGPSQSAWGLRSDVHIGPFPLGVLLGLFAVALACVSLIGDFDFIENAVKGGAPVHVEWKAAFGLILTLVWLYIEFLRIIALLSGRD